MNFNELMAKMRELDAPTPTTTVAPEEGCGDMPGPMGSPMSSPTSMSKPDTPPPTISVNLNAQGMDNIEDLMKLITKVNPDMQKPAADMPSMTSMPSITSLSPLKMLPDMDKEPEVEIPKPDMMNKPDDGDDGVSKAQGDQDNDGDHDMDDHDAEKKKDKEDEAFMNSPENGSDTDTKGISSVVMKGNDIHKPKGTYPKVAGADNPMQRTHESSDLRSQIRAELLQRLAEAKGAK